jgi:hypothetical protein
MQCLRTSVNILSMVKLSPCQESSPYMDKLLISGGEYANIMASQHFQPYLRPLILKFPDWVMGKWNTWVS